MQPALSSLLLGALSAAASAVLAISAAAEQQPAPMPRSSIPPRKVVVGTAVQGFWGPYPGIERRMEQLAALVEEMAARARRQFPNRGLDLAILPENALTLGRSPIAAERAVPLEGPVLDAFAQLARRHRTYLVATLDLTEQAPTGPVYSNAAVLLDRAGNVRGIYRKVHPVAELGQEVLEGGITPGREFPVFECDFGRLGIQICYDMVFDDGWEALARKGVDLIAWPSASPATAQPAARAGRNRCYIVSSTFRHNASIFEPTGVVAAQVLEPERVLVEQLDLSYAVLPWSSQLRNGEAFRERFGERAGFRYHVAEDIGLFWSNDPAMPIGEMVRQIGVNEADTEVRRNAALQDTARGGPAR
jgi:predicted amidohydrolase